MFNKDSYSYIPFNKDFYSYIPLWMINKLDMKLLLYGKEDWFKTAWEQFRKVVMSKPMRDIPDPDTFFALAEKDISSKEEELKEEELKNESTNKLAQSNISKDFYKKKHKKY